MPLPPRTPSETLYQLHERSADFQLHLSNEANLVINLDYVSQVYPLLRRFSRAHFDVVQCCPYMIPDLTYYHEHGFRALCLAYVDAASHPPPLHEGMSTLTYGVFVLMICIVGRFLDRASSATDSGSVLFGSIISSAIESFYELLSHHRPGMLFAGWLVQRDESIAALYAGDDDI